MDQLTPQCPQVELDKHHSTVPGQIRQALRQSSGLLKTIFLKNLIITGSERSAGEV